MLVSGLIFGLIGSFHCMGMCGPIAFMLPVERKNVVLQAFQIISYHLGRITSYAFLGALFGILGKSFYFFGFQQQLSIIVGVFMILLIVLPKYTQHLSLGRLIYRLTSRVKHQLGAELKKKKPHTFYTIGVLNGLLPCGLVYMAVFGALTSSSIMEGSLYMALFGLGTVPLMTAVVYMANFTQRINRQKIQKAIPYVVVTIGLLFVLRGLGLGIPYVSPKPMLPLVDAVMTCH